MGFTTVFTAGMCSANHACIWPRKTSESSKRQSTRYTVLPLSVSSREASFLPTTWGGKPRGFRTVILSVAAMRSSCVLHASPLEREPEVLRRLLARPALDLVDHLHRGHRDRRGHATALTAGDDVPVHVVDLGGPALGHVLGHGRAPVLLPRRGRGEHGVEGLVGLALARVGPLLGLGVVELRDAIAEGQSHARRFG